MANETTSITGRPWHAASYLGDVYLEGHALETRTFHAVKDQFGKLRLYDSQGEARTIAPHDRKQLTVVVEDAVPEAQRKLIDALLADGWLKVVPRN